MPQGFEPLYPMWGPGEAPYFQLYTNPALAILGICGVNQVLEVSLSPFLCISELQAKHMNPIKK